MAKIHRVPFKKWLEICNSIHNIKYKYNEECYSIYNTNVYMKIFDPDYGYFKANIDIHSKNIYSQHPKRLLNSIKKQRKINYKEFIEFVNLYPEFEHYDFKKYNDINQENFTDTRSIIKLYDDEFGDVKMIASVLLSGSHHKKRSNITNRHNKMTFERFLYEANKIHNNLYDYSKSEYIDCDTKMEIIHPIHGSFFLSPYNHINLKLGHILERKRKTLDNDHIIPISIIMDGDTRKNKTMNDRPLFKFLNSSININIISETDNKSKGDIIEINGRKISAKLVRNNYDIIKYVVNNKLKLDISDIIEEDKKYMISKFISSRDDI